MWRCRITASHPAAKGWGVQRCAGGRPASDCGWLRNCVTLAMQRVLETGEASRPVGLAALCSNALLSFCTRHWLCCSPGSLHGLPWETSPGR